MKVAQKIGPLKCSRRWLMRRFILCRKPYRLLGQLKLCKVKPTETVAVISELGKKNDYVNAAHRFRSKPRRWCAGANCIKSLQFGAAALPREARNSRARGRFKVGHGGRHHGRRPGAFRCPHAYHWRGQANYLFVAEPAEVLERLMGTEELRTSASSGAAKLKSGRMLHVSSEAGTDLNVDISGADCRLLFNMVTLEPGRWDHWPSGFVACFPKDRAAQGRSFSSTRRHTHSLAALCPRRSDDAHQERIYYRYYWSRNRRLRVARLFRKLERPQCLCGVSCWMGFSSGRAMVGVGCL